MAKTLDPVNQLLMGDCRRALRETMPFTSWISSLNFCFVVCSNPLKTTIEYYASCLLACASAMAYLARNCLIADATLQIGFADRTLGKHLPSNTVKVGNEIRSRLESIGVYRSNGREHFRGFVTVPLTSFDGTVTGIYGRRIDRNGGGPVELTIGSGIFNCQSLKTFEEVIVTDNVLDAWAFYSAGHKNVVCVATNISDFKHVKRVLLTSEAIDCEPFSGHFEPAVDNCQSPRLAPEVHVRELYRLKFPVGQSAHGYLLAQRDTQADPLGAIIRAAGFCRPISPKSAEYEAVCDESTATAADASDVMQNHRVRVRVPLR